MSAPCGILFLLVPRGNPLSPARSRSGTASSAQGCPSFRAAILNLKHHNMGITHRCVAHTGGLEPPNGPGKFLKTVASIPLRPIVCSRGAGFTPCNGYVKHTMSAGLIFSMSWRQYLFPRASAIFSSGGRQSQVASVTSTSFLVLRSKAKYLTTSSASLLFSGLFGHLSEFIPIHSPHTCPITWPSSSPQQSHGTRLARLQSISSREDRTRLK